MGGHLITLRQEGCTEVVGHVDLVSYPLVGDVVVDKDDRPWRVIQRRWRHQFGLVLVVRGMGA